jgi:hypothetical protein
LLAFTVRIEIMTGLNSFRMVIFALRRISYSFKTATRMLPRGRHSVTTPEIGRKKSAYLVSAGASSGVFIVLFWTIQVPRLKSSKGRCGTAMPQLP